MKLPVQFFFYHNNWITWPEDDTITEDQEEAISEALANTCQPWCNDDVFKGEFNNEQLVELNAAASSVLNQSCELVIQYDNL